MGRQWIVDVHSHVVPTGDDGARTLQDGLKLCRDAANHGTSVLYATPHIHAKWDHYPLTAERLRRYDEAFPVLRAACKRFGLDLRRGFEVYPGALPGSADLQEYGLSGQRRVPDRVPGLLDAGEQTRSGSSAAKPSGPSRRACCRCSPIRSAARRSPPSLRRVKEFVDRGWLLALNGMSLDGRHGPKSQKAAWQLLESGYGDLVASDAHGPNRNARLDWAYELVASRLGVERARGLFDGSALERAGDRSVAA